MPSLDELPKVFADAMEAVGEAGNVERVLLRLGAQLHTDKVMLFSPLLGRAGAMPAHMTGLPAHLVTAAGAPSLRQQDAWTTATERDYLGVLRRGGSLSQQLLPTAELRQSGFYADDLAPLRVDAMVNAIVEASAEHGVYVIAMFNQAGRGEFDEGQLAWLRSAAPWLRALARAERRLADERQAAARLAAGLNQLPLGVVLLAPGGMLVHANEQARQWLHASGPPGATRQPQPGLPAPFARLARVAAHASGPQIERLTSPTGVPLVVLATRLPPRADGAPLVQLTMQPQQTPLGSGALALCAGLFRLTPAEAALLPHLLSGHTPQEVAECLQVKLSTVRTHLSQLLAKTGTRRQAELAQCLLRVVTLVR